MTAVFFRLLAAWLACAPAVWSAPVAGDLDALGEEPELLPAEQAFAFNAHWLAPEAVRAEFKVADGYYLYRDKIRFESEPAGLIGAVALPPGTVQEDEYFGRVAILRGAVPLEIPLQAGAPRRFTLIVHSQGCADLGVCYPPQMQRVTLAAARVIPEVGSSSTEPDTEPDAEARTDPPGAPATLDIAADHPFAALGGAAAPLATEQNEFLPVDAAFAASLNAAAPDQLAVEFLIAPDYYLYRDKLRFALIDGGALSLGEPVLPPGDIKDDEFFGRIAVYHDNARIDLPLRGPATAGQELAVEVNFQGCANAGLCYPPTTRVLRTTLPGAAGGAAAISPADSPADSPAGGQGGASIAPERAASVVTDDTDQLGRLLLGGSAFTVTGAFFLAGLLLAFTACMYPMIPILSGILVGQGAAVTTGRAFGLSLVYVEAMALTYALAGLAAAGLGQGLQAFFQNAWVIATFAGLFVLLALSLFGLYNIQLPASLQSRLATLSNRQRGGGYAGVAVMGVLSALIIGPCAGPVLIAALSYISATGDAGLGALALFAMGQGMGVPLLVIGACGGRLLPKAGPWMNTVRAVFGVVLLGVAIVLLERILPAAAALALWAVLLIVTGVYLGAFAGARVLGWGRLWQGLGVVAVLYGALVLIGAATGGKDVLQPLRGSDIAAVGGAAAPAQMHDLFTRIKTVADLDRELAAAAARGQPAVLDFYADWCTYCVQMERRTFPDPAVRDALASLHLIQADVTAMDAEDRALMAKVRVFLPPAMIFFGPDGGELPGRINGFKNPQEFLAHLARVLPRAELAADTAALP